MKEKESPLGSGGVRSICAVQTGGYGGAQHAWCSNLELPFLIHRKGRVYSLLLGSTRTFSCYRIKLQGLHTWQSLPTHVMNDMGSTKSALSPASLNRRHFCYHIYWGNIKIQIVWFKKEVGHLLSCTIHTFFCKQPAKPDVRWSQLKDGPRTDEEQVRLGFHTEGGRCSISKQALLDLGIPALAKETRLGYNLRTSSGSRLAWVVPLPPGEQ